MLVLLILVGALVLFATGWFAGRAVASTKPDPASPAEPDSAQPAYADVLDRQAVGVVVTDRHGAIEYRNTAAKALAGTHVGALVDGAIDDQLRRSLTGESTEELLDLYGPPRRVIDVVTEPLDDGRAVAFVTDVSERHRTERVRTDFVANVSHELRTPIGALLVLAEALQDADDPADVERIVARMSGEAERASRTIDDLLELSSIEAAVEVEAAPVRLSDVVRDAVGRVTELAAASDIALSTLDPVDRDGPRADGVVVLGDRRHLSSAVGNLVENAVKYSDPGDAVQVRVRSTDGFAEISVVDEGAGIPRSDLDRVFERFYRVDRARSRQTGGTGLGLSIVRHVAQLHGGTVHVDSVEGEGTTFVLRLPLMAQEPAEDVAPDSDAGVA